MKVDVVFRQKRKLLKGQMWKWASLHMMIFVIERYLLSFGQPIMCKVMELGMKKKTGNMSWSNED